MATVLPTATRTDVSGLGAAARGGVLNLAAAGFSGLAGLLITTVVARGLGHAMAGVFFAATSAFLLAQMLAKLGTDTGLVYWLARLRAVRRSDLLHRCLRVGLGPVLVAAVVAAVLLFTAAPWFAQLSALTDHDGDAPHADGYIHQLRVLAVFLPAAALSDALLSATRGYRRMGPTAAVEKFIRPALQTVLLLGAVWLAGRTTAYTVAWTAPYLASVVLAGWWLAVVDRRQPQLLPEADAGAPIAGVAPERLGRQFWYFTAPRAVSSVGQLALQRLDVLLVAGMLGFPAAALYTVATRFIVVGQLGSQAIGRAVQPRLAELLAREQTDAVRGLYQGSTAWTVLLTWPLFLLTGIFAPLYLTVFGSGYAVGSTSLVVGLLCVAMLVAGGCGMVDMVLTMGGRTTWNLANVAVAFGTNLVLDLVLIPRWGIIGAAAGWAIALLVKNLMPLAQIAVVLRVHPFGPATLWAVLLSVLTVGVPAGAARLLFGAGPVGLVVALGLACPLYLGTCFLFRNRLGLARLLRRPGIQS
ncbi:MAG: polysaccharide biosynthesis C-terminal domain-containing protein [Actinocatenispora sp.]